MFNDIRFYIWVTSDCNLSCRYCSQKYTIEQNKGYHMSIEEVFYIVQSCKARNMRFDVIELTGGEASLWNNLIPGIKLFKQVCDDVTMVTNGNNPELVLSLDMREFIVSSSQASPKQMSQYLDSGRPILYNAHTHKKLPEEPIPNSLPGKCCVMRSARGIPQTPMEYIRGKVYYCCDAFAHTERTGISDDIVCDFEDDFVKKFSARDNNKAICSYCLCNSKVWDAV